MCTQILLCEIIHWISDVAELVAGYMGVNLSCFGTAMTEYLLYVPQIDALLQ